MVVTGMVAAIIAQMVFATFGWHINVSSCCGNIHGDLGMIKVLCISSGMVRRR
jgi:uncharacterized membrane protein YeaQ/YmgE (transglycosylase-associated protein family)